MYTYFIYDIITRELFDCGLEPTAEEVWWKTRVQLTAHPDSSIGVNIRCIDEETIGKDVII